MRRPSSISSTSPAAGSIFPARPPLNCRRPAAGCGVCRAACSNGAITPGPRDENPKGERERSLLYVSPPHPDRSAELTTKPSPARGEGNEFNPSGRGITEESIIPWTYPFKISPDPSFPNPAKRRTPL